MTIAIITIIIFTAAAVACILAAKQNSRSPFRCESCMKDFNADWKDLLTAMHSDDCYSIRCPHCGKKGCRKLTVSATGQDQS